MVLVILGIQSRGAEVVDPETELADLEIPVGALAMAGKNAEAIARRWNDIFGA